MSTIRVNNLQNTSTTDGGISINASGHVTVDGVAMPSSGPLSNRNLIINGAMRVAQRGTSSISAGFATVDRIEGGFTGGAVTQSQGTLTTGAGDSTVYNLGFRHYFRQTNTTAASDTAAHHRNIRYRVEAQDLATSGWNYTSSSSYITFSFYVRSSVAQQFYGYIKTENGTERIYPFSTGSLSADTWTKVEKTIPGDSSLTIPNDNSSGVQIFIAPFWGTNFTASSVSLDAWANYAGGTRAPDYTTTWATTASATFDVTGLQLEVGSVATPFEHRSYGDELARCQRYYQRISASSDSAYARILPLGHMATNTVLRVVVPLHPPMRTQPTFNQSGSFATQPNAGTTVLSLETVSSAGSESVTLIDNTSISGTAGNSTSINANNDSSAFVEFIAEL